MQLEAQERPEQRVKQVQLARLGQQVLLALPETPEQREQSDRRVPLVRPE